MPQIFTPSGDAGLRLALVLAVVLVVGAGLLLGGYVPSSDVTLVGWVVDQPVPFSDEHHVGGMGIDCRYCHAGVETS